MIENMIIAIEGIDGAGKTTLLATLREQLHAEVIAFPRYETSIHAQLVRRALYQQMGDLTDSVYAMAPANYCTRLSHQMLWWFWTGMWHQMRLIHGLVRGMKPSSIGWLNWNSIR